MIYASVGLAQQSNQQLLQQVESLQAKYESAVPENRIDDIMELYEQDALYLPAQGNIRQGKEQIKAAWMRTLSMNIFDFDLQTVKVSSSGNMVTEVGKTIAQVEMNGDTIEIKSKYLNVWRRQDDGQLKLHRGIYNPLTDI